MFLIRKPDGISKEFQNPSFQFCVCVPGCILIFNTGISQILLILLKAVSILRALPSFIIFSKYVAKFSNAFSYKLFESSILSLVGLTYAA